MDQRSAVERCYVQEHDKLWRALLLFSADPEISSDAVAEAFAQALQRGDAVRHLDRWIWKSAFAIARGELQRRSRNEPLHELAYEMPTPSIDVTRALASLSPKQRASVVLYHYAGYSTKEAAQIIGSTAPAVGVHLKRGRARLREILTEDEDA